MPDTVLETLVKLASLGTSGICIFAIFWIGWLLSRPATSQDAERQRTLRFFMIVCVVISLVSAGTGFWGKRIDAQEFVSLKKWKQEYETRKQWYMVKGKVKKEGDSDSGDINITTRFPPLSPDGSGNIIGLRVRKDYDGNLPSLGFSCPGYKNEGLNLDDQDLTNNVIDIRTVTLHKIPCE
jgi:hypothetical protein